LAKQLDVVLPANKLDVAKSTVGGLGGTIGVRVIVDDAVVPGKSDAIRLIDAAKQFVIEDTWPPA
jgi:hypothetical protein